MNYQEFIFELKSYLGLNNISEEYVSKNSKEKRTTVLYGRGHAALYYIRYLKQRNVEVKAIIDSDTRKIGETFEGIKILSLKTVLELYSIDEVDIVISSPKFRKEIKRNLSVVFPEDQIYSFEVELYVNHNTNSELIKKFVLENTDTLWSVFNGLKDEKSKINMLAVIKGRITGDLSVVEGVWEKEQYWPKDVIEFSNCESIIECGSSDGKTLVEMYDKLQGQFRNVYCFEPSQEAFLQLKKVIEKFPNKNNIFSFMKGTYFETTTLFFRTEPVEGGLSKLSNEGSLKIEVISLDDFIKKEITYIKMDIEGAELDTLKGAENLIKRYRPKLAVCIYHKDDDMVNIFMYLKSIVPEYNFYIRHHNCNMEETVLYAI